MVAPDAEVDPGHTRERGAQEREHLAGVGRHEHVVVVAAEGPGPRVEHLERACAGTELRADERGGVLDELLHQRMPQLPVGVHQRLGVLVRARRPALDEVTGHRERCTGERQQRHRFGQFAGEDAHGLEHVRDVDRWLEGSQAGEIVVGTQRLVGHRARAWRNVDAETDGMRRDHDVAVEHGSVDPVAAHRLQRDLGCQVGPLDGVEDAAGSAHSAVLGQASSGLAHEPDRRVARRPTVCGVEQGDGRGGVRHLLGTLSLGGRDAQVGRRRRQRQG